MFLENLAKQLIDGDITLDIWQAEMRKYIQTINRQAALVAVGGVGNMTQSTWGYLGYLIKQQYQFLDGFAEAIRANPQAWLNGRLLTRMNLYSKAEWSTFEQMIRFLKKQEGWTEERAILGVADHCSGCLERARQVWQPIGTLAPIGSKECSTNCHCTFKYRRPNGAGGWIYD